MAKIKKKKSKIIKGATGTGNCEAYCVDNHPPAYYLAVSPDHKKRWFVCSYCATEAHQEGWQVFHIGKIEPVR